MTGDGWRTTRWHVQDSPVGGPCITAGPASPDAADADVIVDLVRSPDIAEHITELHNRHHDLAALLHAAQVWRAVRQDRAVTGDVYHQACRALDDAIAVHLGEQITNPTPPPTAEELAHSESVVKRLRDRADRLNRASGLTPPSHYRPPRSA